MQPPRKQPVCTAGATSSSIRALLFKTRPWAGHGGVPTRQPFQAGVCMHAGTLRPHSRQRTDGGMSLLSAHVLHAQPQPASLPGDACGMAGGMETTWQDAAGCSTSIEPRPLSKQTGSWDFLPSLGHRTSKWKFMQNFTLLFARQSLLWTEGNSSPFLSFIFPNHLCRTAAYAVQLTQFLQRGVVVSDKKSLAQDAGPAWAFGLSVAELQKAPCRAHAPPALPASPGSLLSPVPRSRQQRRAEHVLQYQFIACYYFPAFGGSWHLPALFSCQLDKD